VFFLFLLSAVCEGSLQLLPNYLSKCNNSILEMIRNKVHGKIFVSIGEICDMEACYMANIIIRTLEIDGPVKVGH
jgi:hypothetical protein